MRRTSAASALVFAIVCGSPAEPPPSLVTDLPFPAGALVQRATFAPPLPQPARQTRAVLWGPVRQNGAPPLLYQLVERTENGADVVSWLAWLDAGLTGKQTTGSFIVYHTPVSILAADPAQQRLFVVRERQGAVDVYDLAADGVPLLRGAFACPRVPEEPDGSDLAISNVAVSADGGTAFVAVPRKGRAYAFAAARTGQTSEFIFSASAGVSPQRVSLSPDGNTLAVVVQGNRDNPSSVALFDVVPGGEDLMPRGRFVPPGASLDHRTRLAFDSSSTTLFVPGGATGTLYAVPAGLTGTATAAAAAYAAGQQALTLAISADRSRLAVLQPTLFAGTPPVASVSGEIRIFDVALSGALALRSTFRSRGVLLPRDRAMAFTPDNRHLLTYVRGDENAVIAVDAVRSGTFEETTSKVHTNEWILSLALSRDGGLAAAALLAREESASTWMHVAPDPDRNGDGRVDGTDLLALIEDWRQPGPAAARPGPTDFALDVVRSAGDILAWSRLWQRD